jgi:hypothetical protein
MKQNTKQLLGVLSFNPEKRRRIVDRSRNSNFHRKDAKKKQGFE